MNKVLIATPLRNEEENLPRFFSLLENLDYPTELLSFAFLEGDSTDKTYELLLEWKKFHPNLKIWLKKLDLGMEKTKFERLATSRNTIVKEALTNQDYVFWIDADIETLPPNTLRTLIEDDKDIVAPLAVYGEPSKSLYYLGRSERPRIEELENKLVEVGFVGICFLVKRIVYEANVKCSILKTHGETITFCQNARQKGFSSYVDTKIHVKHPLRKWK